MDCADDAARIQAAVSSVSGVESVRVSVASQILTVATSDGAPDVAGIEAAVASAGFLVEPGSGEAEASDVAESAGGGGRPDAVSPSSHDGARRRMTHRSAGYRRALWVVVALNLGYGVVEGVGGFLAGSQALKADALDFLGDGFITLLGLVAIGWSAQWRSRTALLQGAFLGVLGLAVLGNTVYRMLVPQVPDAGAMGILAFVALLVNLAAAAVLIPYRAGDANVRAVWLFSRNDAIGNLAVLAAAGLVAVLGNPWPDLAVGALVALLFLHSSWQIIVDARADLAESADWHDPADAGGVTDPR